GGGSTALYVVGGAAIVGGAVAIGVNNNKSSNNATSTPLPSNTPTRTPTSTPTPFATIIAQASWSGLGDVDVQVLDPDGQSVGSNLPSGCESTAQRNESVVLQRAPSGNYRMMVSAKSCGIGTPASIAAVVSVQLVGGQPLCPNSFVNIPVGSAPIQACTFTVQ
ncbi:MAG TPA: hypothetical protein VK780_04005, partial [Thermoanaerobaculia bacterium]|nr:hypothetical protein [Thermoanaerobaculia bacterium]